MKLKFYFVSIFLIALLVCESKQETKKPKKSIADMTDAEIDKIAEEWDVSLF